MDRDVQEQDVVTAGSPGHHEEVFLIMMLRKQIFIF